MFGIMFLRVILYFVIRIMGYEFWLFPNYLEDVKLIIPNFMKSVDSSKVSNLLFHSINVMTEWTVLSAD